MAISDGAFAKMRRLREGGHAATKLELGQLQQLLDELRDWSPEAAPHLPSQERSHVLDRLRHDARSAARRTVDAWLLQGHGDEEQGEHLFEALLGFERAYAAAVDQLTLEREDGPQAAMDELQACLQAEAGSYSLLSGVRSLWSCRRLRRLAPKLLSEFEQLEEDFPGSAALVARSRRLRHFAQKAGSAAAYAKASAAVLALILGGYVAAKKYGHWPADLVERVRTAAAPLMDLPAKASAPDLLPQNAGDGRRAFRETSAAYLPVRLAERSIQAVETMLRSSPLVAALLPAAAFSALQHIGAAMKTETQTQNRENQALAQELHHTHDAAESLCDFPASGLLQASASPQRTRNGVVSVSNSPVS